MGLPGERRKDLEVRSRFDDWCTDLRHRLHRICADMPSHELEDLIARMNRIRARYEAFSAVPRDRF